MFFGGLTIAINGFSMVFLFFYHRFQWFSMVLDHWSNDAMVSMDRCGLLYDHILTDTTYMAIRDGTDFKLSGSFYTDIW